MTNNTKTKTQTGFLTLEILLSLMLLGSLVLASIALVFSNQALAIDTQNNTEALAQAKAGLENAVTSGFNFIPPPDTNVGGFNLHLQTTWLANYAKSVTSKSTYAFSGRPQSVEVNGLLTDTNPELGRDTCSLNFSGSWQSPIVHSNIITAINNPATAVDVNNNLAYVATNASNQALEDFYVYDVTDVDHPTLKGKLNTGPGLNALHVAGNFAFAASNGVASQLHIINVTNPASPTVLKIKVPNWGGVSSDGKGTAIFYSKNKIYLGLTKSNGPELHVYDVSNPSAPVWLGAYETNTGINGIYVFNNIAYLALADGKLLTALDVSDPSHISETGFYSPPGSASQSGQSVSVLGDNIFLGRAGGLPALGYKELYAINSSNLTNPIADYDLNSSVRGIFARGGLLFLATNEASKELQIFSYGSSLSPLSNIDLPAEANGLDCEGNNIFLSLNNGSLQIVSPGN